MPNLPAVLKLISKVSPFVASTFTDNIPIKILP